MFRKKAFLAIVISTGFIASNISLAASFDCAMAGTKIEKMICSNVTTSQLDEELSKVYKAGIERTQDKKIYQESQSIWLKYNRNSCASTECLSDAYKERIKSQIGRAHV